MNGSVGAILIFSVQNKTMETNLLSVSYVIEIMPWFSYTKDKFSSICGLRGILSLEDK